MNAQTLLTIAATASLGRYNEWTTPPVKGAIPHSCYPKKSQRQARKNKRRAFANGFKKSHN